MRSFSRRDVLGLAFPFALLAIIYRPLLFEGRVLASLDSEAYFYPNASYLAASLRVGRIPLWNPLIFAGVPFLANSQVGALYPPSWLLLLGPVSSVASILVVGHLALFAVGMYLCARVSLGLGPFGATFAAAVAATGGLTGGMVGHLNQVEALAWAPFSILLVERAIVRSSPRLSALASLPLAIAVLSGHLQVVYLTAAIALACGAARVIQKAEPLITAGWIGRQVSILVCAPVLAIFLSGIQILPTVELSRLSIRSSGLVFADAAAGSLPPPYLLTALLPTIGQAPPSTEWIGYVSVSALLLALYGLGKHRRIESWWLVGVAVIGLVLALGQYTPLYGIAYAIVPGFRLFRVPARWLTLWIVGVSLLAAFGAEAATAGGPGTDDGLNLRSLRRSIYARARGATTAWFVMVGGLILTAALLGIRYRHAVSWPSTSTLFFWTGAAIGLIVGFGITSSSSLGRRGWLLALLVAELVTASAILPVNEAVWPDAIESPRATVTDVLSTRSTDRVLAIGDNSYDPGDLAPMRARLDDTLPATARDAYVTAVKHVEGMTPNTLMRYGIPTVDGYDGGILPLARYRDFKQLFASEGPDVTDGRLRIQLKLAPSPSLLGWLNVRWLLMDRLRDRWIDGTYYDLGIAQPLAADTPIQIQAAQPFDASRLGVFLRGPSNRPPSGVLAIQVGERSVSLQTDVQSGAPVSVDPTIDPNGMWFWLLPLPARVHSDAASISWHGEDGTFLRAISAIDDSSGAGETFTVSPTMRLGFLGDMKTYDNLAVLPRAFLTNGLTVSPTTISAVTRMRGGAWNARNEAVSVASEVDPALAFQAGGAVDPASIVVDQPEHVVVHATASDRRVLVLTDSYYPGWQVTVDGSVAPILPVNLLFRGVVLVPGTHVVEFTYRPGSWYAGIVVSGLGLAALTAILMIPGRWKTGHDVV